MIYILAHRTGNYISTPEEWLPDDIESALVIFVLKDVKNETFTILSEIVEDSLW